MHDNYAAIDQPTTMNYIALIEAIQKARPIPLRASPTDSRQSTPEIFPSHGYDEFEFWREPLEELEKHVPSMDYRMRIMDAAYWKVESAHWKTFFGQILAQNNIDRSMWESHSLDIDAKYWETVSSLDWRQYYRDLDFQHASLDPEDRRSKVQDLIFYKISAEQWKSLCAERDNSRDLEEYRKMIRSYDYWQTEFNEKSKACSKLQGSAVEKGRTRPAPREQDTHRTRIHKQRSLRAMSQTRASPMLPNAIRRKPRLPPTTTCPKTRLRRSERIKDKARASGIAKYSS